ncbi:MAG: hypothetical protein WCG25_07820 [bacterium]
MSEFEFKEAHLFQIHAHIFTEAIAFKSDQLYHFAITLYVHFLFNILLNFCHTHFNISAPSPKLHLILSILPTFLVSKSTSTLSFSHHILSVIICIQY